MTTFKDNVPASPSPSDTSQGKMTLAQIFESLVGGNLSIRITAYDGSSAGPADAEYGLNLKNSRGTTYLVTAPGDLGLARAYIAGDLAYYLDKRERGADCAVYLLGADHHGYVARLKAAAAALGDSPEAVEVLIGQMVNLVKDGTAVRMSKRAGTVVTMEDLVEVVGVDAARYSLTRYSVDSNIDIDLDVLTKRSNENPVFYVQYAHARTCAVARNAEAAGVRRLDEAGAPQFDAALLEHPREADLLAALGQYPSVVAQAAEFREPHRVARHLHFAAPEVACVQGALDFYNPRTNWLARCFTLEYSSWFRGVLPGA